MMFLSILLLLSIGIVVLLHNNMMGLVVITIWLFLLNDNDVFRLVTFILNDNNFITIFTSPFNLDANNNNDADATNTNTYDDSSNSTTAAINSEA